MSFLDLRSYLKYLKINKDLLIIKDLVDPNQEISIIHQRVISMNGPAILFENVKGSPYKVVTNLFGTRKRVNSIFKGNPSKLGYDFAKILNLLLNPTLKSFFKNRDFLLSLVNSRVKKINNGPINSSILKKFNLENIPVLTCWPEDAGAFFTLPLVHTVSPKTGVGNIGMYRLQRFTSNTTGVHWQIGKGGALHFYEAKQLNKRLPVTVILGGPPALMLSAIFPLPEGIDERLLAAYIMGKPLDVVLSKYNDHKVPATSEFVIEGVVDHNDTRLEGPFGDHFGHYSFASKFPILKVKNVMARKGAIYPATIVGKPIQEDFYIGEAIQNMCLPIIRTIHPGIVDLWSYPEAGFHSLTVVSVRERYPKEALKYAMGILGEGQLSLSKVVIVVDSSVNVKNIYEVSENLWKYLDFRVGLYLFDPTLQDTLDFTGLSNNCGSKLILLAMKTKYGFLRKESPKNINTFSNICDKIIGMTSIGPSFLIIKVKKSLFNLKNMQKILMSNLETKKYLFHILVSEDISLKKTVMILWGWFTRFDPMQDLYSYKKLIVKNKLQFVPPILIDARWKDGYPKPLEFDPNVEKRVNKIWDNLVF